MSALYIDSAPRTIVTWTLPDYPWMSNLAHTHSVSEHPLHCSYLDTPRLFLDVLTVHEWQVGHLGIVWECPSNNGIFRHRVCGASWTYTYTVYSDTRVCEGQGGHPGIVWVCPGNMRSHPGIVLECLSESGTQTHDKFSTF